MLALWPLLLPELERFPPPEQPAALRRARHTDMDWLELLGVAFAVVLVTWITEYIMPTGSIGSRALALAVNAFTALPLLALAIAPLQWRRLRRGLRAQLKRARP
jgi:hypothetical protein